MMKNTPALRTLSIILTALLLVAMLPAASFAAGGTVTVADTTGGKLELSAASAGAGDVVTGTITADSGYDIATVRYEYNGSYQFADISGNTFSFKMPSAASVKVVGTFFSKKVWDGAVDISWYDPAQSEYHLSEPAELAGLAALINGMTDADTPDYKIKGDRSYIKCGKTDNVLLVGAGGGNVADTVYWSELDFAHKTVYLDADLDMGGRRNGENWTGPNYTPVGGRYSMDNDMVDGDSLVINTRFNGVFDGQGHTVSNIYCQRYALKGFPYSMAVGLIGYLGGNSEFTDKITGTFEDGWQPAARNVVVGEGYILGRRMIGGVVGNIGETSNGVIVENCANYAEVMNTDARGVGGVVGQAYGPGMIRNCYNAGHVSTIFSCPAGGIIGSNCGIDIINCYNYAKIESNGAVRGRGIGSNDTGVYTIDNCFYLDGCDDDPDSEGYYIGVNTRISVNVKKMSASDMKGSAMLSALNRNGQVFKADTSGINNGYPVLFYQGDSSAFDGTFEVAAEQPSNGTIDVNPIGTVRKGTVLNLMSIPEDGYVLKNFTIDGKAIESSFYLVTKDTKVGGVFEKRKTSRIIINEPAGQEVTVVKTGLNLVGGVMTQVVNEPVNDGDTLYAGDILQVRAGALNGAAPADGNLEYTNLFNYTVTNATKTGQFTYLVSGDGPVTVTAERTTREKTWSAVADTSWYKAGSTTYVLTKASQLAGLAELVNSKGITFEGKTIELGNDISLKNLDETAGRRVWNPIGTTMSKSFQGTFDGKGYQIADMSAVSTGSYSGLFGYCVGATVKNLTIKGSSTSSANTAYAAGLVSYASASRIENCVSRVNVSTTGVNAGGIAAYTCDGTVIKDCINCGDVSAASGAGGIVGIQYTAADSITGCTNYGAVSATGSGTGGAGGIAGKLTGKMSDSINAGTVTSVDRYTGGLAGYMNGRNSSSIENSANTGAVTCSNSTVNAALGGIVGYFQYGVLANDKNTGTVKASTGFAGSAIGAIAGKIGSNYITVNNCTYSPASADGAAERGPLNGATADAATSVAVPEAPADANPVVVLEDLSQNLLGVTKGDLTGNANITKNGTYYLRWYAAGDINIADGLAVTLVGTGKEMGELTIRAGKNVKLTIEDVSAKGIESLMYLSDGCTLTLKGSNSFENTGDSMNLADSTIVVSGNVTVNGDGRLYAKCQKRNACINVLDGANLKLVSGIVSLYKDTLLGFDGGALTAANATVTIAGGSLICHSDDDNISGIRAKNLTIQSGSLNAVCYKSTHAIDITGSGKADGGIVRAIGHGGLGDFGKNYYFYKADTTNGIKPAKYYDETLGFGAVVASRQNVTFNGRQLDLEVYNIDGSNYFKLRDIAALMDGTGSTFGLDYSAIFKTMYATSGQPYEAAGGELLTGTDKSSSTVGSMWTLYVDGQLVPCKVYNIGGNNFFKLRDLGTALGFGVEFDQDTNTAAMTSK